MLLVDASASQAFHIKTLLWRERSARRAHAWTKNYLWPWLRPGLTQSENAEQQNAGDLNSQAQGYRVCRPDRSESLRNMRRAAARIDLPGIRPSL
jgi:hypothetical protein